MSSKKEQSDTLKRKTAAMPQFDLKCRVCHKKYGKNFLFHHKKYHTGEKVYKDFPNTYLYNLYVLPIVANDPNRFRLLCGAHHNLVEKLKRFKSDKFERLVEVVRESE
jgi:hypothetical protein